MAGLTLSHKILARAAGRTRVATGDHLICRVDRAMTYEPFAGELDRRFAARWGAETRVWDPDRLVLVVDHFLDAADPASADLRAAADRFARRMGLVHYYPPGAANHGVCHALMAEEGLVRPGELIVGSDSHSCTYGGFGAIGLGVGLEAIEGVLAVGECWLRVPPTVRIEIAGAFAPDVQAKDVILAIVRDLGFRRGLLGTGVELDGEAVQALHPEEKLTLANMAAEAGARWLVVPPNDEVAAWVAALADAPFEPLRPDRDAAYDAVYRYRGEDFVPVVARPHAPDAVVAVSDLPRTAFSEVYVGSCTGAKRFDLDCLADRLAALGGPAPGMRLLVVPATRKARDGLLSDPERAALFRRPGVELAAEPGCNACFGGHGFLAEAGAVRLSTTNRNFRGRMGSPEAEVYLASPARAAEAAARGALGR